MGALFKLILMIYLITLLFGCFISLVIFAIDVFRWHDKEEKVYQIPSNDHEDKKGSEVKESVAECGECDSPTIFGTGC